MALTMRECATQADIVQDAPAASELMPPTPPSPTEEEKQERSWQYHGYPAFAEWMASSDDFFVLRRFSKESARCLLRLQHEIAKASKDLDDLDEFSRNQPPGWGGCDTFEEDKFHLRPQMIERMEYLLQRYYNLVNAFNRLHRSRTATPQHLRNLANWFETYPEAIDPREQHFRAEDKENDLFTLVFEDRSPLRLLLHEWRWLRLLFKPGNTAGLFKATSTHYTSDTALDKFATIIVLVAGVCLLLGPMWAVHLIREDTHRFAIITGFTSAFTGLAFLAAGHRPLAILVATAVYAAVPIVSLQRQ